MATVGYATLQVIPSMRGTENALVGMMSGPASAEGDRAGKSFGAKFKAAIGPALAVGAATFGTAAIVGFAREAIGAASDLGETVSKSNVIFEENAGAIDTWAKGASRNLGLSRAAALGTAADFGNMFSQLGFAGGTAADMSKEVVQLSADLGSFNNLPTAEVADMMSGAFRGEFDSLQRLIPNLNAARVEQEALTATGKASAAELTAQEKAAATLAIVQRDGAKAAGDFARTSGGAANASKILAAQTEDLKARIGSGLLPAWTGLITFASGTALPAVEAFGGFLVNDLVPAVVRFGSILQENSGTLAIVAAVVSTVLLPVFASMTVAATTSGAATVRSWVAQRVAAVSSSAAQVAAHYRTAAGWVVSSAAAVRSGAQTVAVWTLYRVEAAKGAAATVAAHGRMAAAWVASRVQAAVSAVAAAGAWVASSARTVGALAVQGAAFLAQRAVMVAGAAATGLVTAAQWAWNAALNANPIGLVVLAIAALVGAFVFAWKNSETFRAVVTGAWEGVKAAAEAVGRWFTVTVPAWWSGVLADTRAKWQAVTGVFTTVRTNVQAAVQQVLDKVRTVFGYTPIGLITTNFGAIVSFFTGIPGKIAGALSDAPRQLREAGSRIIGALADGITGAVGKVTSAVSGVMSKVRDFLPFSPAKVGPFSGRGWALYSGRSVPAAFATGMLQNRDKMTNAAESVMRAAKLAMPLADVAGVVGASRGAVVAAPSDELVGSTRGRGSGDGSITINGNVGWTLEEVERQRRDRTRRRAQVRGLRPAGV